ncbi:MAG: hypothetical protein COV07_00410 [Candidatus Vogelbacteria bacterium CG10_big_fil_rev_8_21_14_0_10_45_14]|uniref:DUF2914 domain-containing protein n=1 Tax=Candidatus Vogelbacteria bacterium CG10_big_fil_rev_8_21_14_0_10_45_14 TaxID=1975042 RepID=A0A2H0RMB2_9BACT|nr:MAG: hypothetical protein COV07_00410 [Candidatus Vogelbacteria bacterium CG10_big_fil_rev_8_21_14_0_10_45_14]
MINLVIETQFYARVKSFVNRNERKLFIFALVCGLLFDSLTLRRIDALFDNLIFAGHLSLLTISFLVLYAYEANRLKGRFFEFLFPWIPFILQFSFGALFSGFIVFYTRSASLYTSWPFILGLAGLLIGNEFFRSKYAILSFRISIYFVVLLSFFAFLVPVLLRSIGVVPFVLSGGLSLFVVAILIASLYKIAPGKLWHERKHLLVSLLSIYILFNVFYFANVIPPIPLALRDSGIFHMVERTSTQYFGTYEKSPWYMPFRRESKVFHRYESSPVYAYSAIYAPTRIGTTVEHRWYTKSEDNWKLVSSIPIVIHGGRDGGYRGYSFKSNITDGKWRVDVVTARGQLLGRIVFTIQKTDTQPDLQKISL